MASRPRPLNTEPSGTLITTGPKTHPGLYPVPEDDPNFYEPEVWEPFIEAYRFSGGSISECYRLATLDWDTDRFGNPPAENSLRAKAKREDWHGRAMKLILDRPAEFQEMADAELEMLKPLATRALRDILTGERKAESGVIKAISTALYFGVSGTMARKFGRAEYNAHKPPPPEPEAPPPPPLPEDVEDERKNSWRQFKSKDQIHVGDE